MEKAYQIRKLLSVWGSHPQPLAASCGAMQSPQKRHFRPMMAPMPISGRRRGGAMIAAANWRASRTCKSGSGKTLPIRILGGHSPEQICGRLTQEHSTMQISPESIYRFAYSHAHIN